MHAPQARLPRCEGRVSPDHLDSFHTRRPLPVWQYFGWLLASLITLWCAFPRTAAGAELTECRDMLIRGEYQACIRTAHEAIAAKRYGETWPVLKVKAQIATGQYEAALQAVEAGIKRYSWSVRLRWVGREAALKSGQLDLAETRLTEIADLVKRFSWRYTDAEELVILGEIDEMNGVDAREVLSNRYEKAQQRNRLSREPWLAIGELALDKNDAAFAAETFTAGLKQFPDDPDLHFGLARALAASNSPDATAAITAALMVNGQHISSLLFQIDRLISSEEYDKALELISRIRSVNPHQSEAWAYRAVVAHFTNDPRGEAAARDHALDRWSSNPRVDHIIGRKLSQHYRFKEGAAYQRRALSIDPKFVPARRQLAQDLLRLGDEAEGWQVVEQAHEQDAYNVQTFNLLELQDELSGFVTLEDGSFLLRMERIEAQLYGTEVLELLNRAKVTLSEKYGLTLKDRVTVEVFPNQDDFAVRTFGMPAVSGYLGVCFGKVITANSPASRRENPSNWEAVLWHEFCHVVTLELTRNRIPRWLSEGISVYEEVQAHATWGQKMDPRSRQHILEGALTPLGQLSSAFMNPKSGWHLNFAYFESAMAVDFLVQNYGLEAVRNVLDDLKAGLPINVALDRRCAALAQLEQNFDDFAKQQANALAPGLDWSKPELDVILAEDNDALEAWVREHPNNFVGLIALSTKQIEEAEWEAAEITLKRLISLYPGYEGGDNAYEKLARVYRELNRPSDERRTLEQFASISSEAVAANHRLIELQTADADWTELARTARRLQGVDPLLRTVHAAAAVAAERLDNPVSAVTSLERLLLLEPDDPAETHYRLAHALHSIGRLSEAKRHTLQAQEEAPRYRDAHRLLLQIVQNETNADTTETTSVISAINTSVGIQLDPSRRPDAPPLPDTPE
jgi:tetratricopeptide (TPR) repeat protein